MIYLMVSCKIKSFKDLNCLLWLILKYFFDEEVYIEVIKIAELLIEFVFSLKVTKKLKDILDIY
jgi:hypothetical protein